MSHENASPNAPSFWIPVLDNERVRGMPKPGEARDFAVLRPFHVAFLETAWPTDAHFVTYQPNPLPPVPTTPDLYEGDEFRCRYPGAPGSWPRCNKTSLGGLRDLKIDLVTCLLVHDWDNPGHEPWTLESFEAFKTLLQGLHDSNSIFARYTLLYFTRAGARFVYVLDRFLPVDEAESYHRGMVERAAAHGLIFDPGCSDWTRLFRLPWVLRRNKDDTLEPTWETTVEDPDYHPENMLSVDELTPDGTASTTVAYAEITPIDLPKPTADEAYRLLTTVSANGNAKPTKWCRWARERLEGKRCFPAAFEGLPLAAPGAQDETIQSYVGEAVAYTMGSHGTTPEHVYALFLDSVLIMDRHGGRDPTDSLWAAVCRYWALETAKGVAEVREQEKRKLDATERLEKILHGMREWCEHDGLQGNDRDALDWAVEHMIAVAKTGYFLVNENGYFESYPMSREQLIARIRDSGLDAIIPIKEIKNDGWQDISPQTVVNRHGTAVCRIQGRIGVRQGFVENMGNEGAVLVVKTFGRKTDLVPLWDRDVDAWLQELGGKWYQDLCEWIGKALAFEVGPIAALSIVGAAGSGKNMLVRGLAEAIDTEAVAGGMQLVGQFNGPLMKTPFLHIDENWPNTRNLPFGIADKFRELTGGCVVQINDKNEKIVDFHTNPRIIITANKEEVVQQLGQGDLSSECRAAIVQRLFHIDAKDRAANWLRLRGGLNFTAAPGRLWVKNAQGQGDFIVARHFLFLYEQWKGALPQNRFLMEGRNTEEILLSMRTEGGAAPLLAETLIAMLNASEKAGGRRFPGLTVDNGRIFVLSGDILKFFRSDAGIGSSTKNNLTNSQLSRALKAISCCQHDRIMLESRRDLGRQRWVQIDLHLLKTFAEQGYPCPTLDRLVDGARVIELQSEIDNLDKPPQKVGALEDSA